MDNFYVWDARNNNSTGPFSKDDAAKCAANLNLWVLGNECPILLQMGGKPTGPFYVRGEEAECRARARRRERGLGFTL